MHFPQSIESSIIIPVYNQWKFTQKCLEALRATLPGNTCEIIVIDNASTDATPAQCPALGKELFGNLFHYHRAERNLNFGPASNLGARKARGEFLVFLNNDTEPLPGWYEPLIEDFTAYPDIAGTGPLLLYPEEGPLGRTVQHLGVVMTPSLSVKHLYEGIPETSPLIRKRRFFQIITGACLVMRRSLFLEAGQFDERFINGCEDIDLCIRLWSAGYRMTVNPVAKVIHHTSQTPGRFTHNQENFQLLTVKSLHNTSPDWPMHLHHDRLTIKLTPWQIPIAAYSQEQTKALEHLFTSAADPNALRDRLIDFPLWEEGYRSLSQMLAEQGEDTRLLDIAHDKLFRNQEYMLARYLKACEAQDEDSKGNLLANLLNACVPYESYVHNAQTEHARLTKLNLLPLAGEYADWLNSRHQFRDKHYFPFMYALWKSQHDVQRTKRIPFELYMADGYAKTSKKSASFDYDYYAHQYPEFYGPSHNPFIHYTLQGKAEGALHRKPKTLITGYNGTHQELHDAAFKDDSCRVLAWYLPQFHPIGENDVAWGKGFTEWANVAAATPRFDGHYQPRLPGALGFYDLRRKETLEEQIALAKHAGIHGFCLHHYWFHGHKVLHTPLDHLKNEPSLDFPFCLHWANEPWTRRWDGSDQDIIIRQHYSPEDDLAFIKDIDWALRDKRYIKFQGKPVLGIYRHDLFPDIQATIARLRAYCRQNGIGEIFLFGSQSFRNSPAQILDAGFDGAVEYPPHGCAITPINAEYSGKNIEYLGFIRRYTDARDVFLTATDTIYTRPIFRGTMPGWDNSPRRRYNGQLYVEATPNAYAAWLRTTLSRTKKDAYPGEKYVFINAWNEWAECAYLEPDAKYGAAILNATARTIDTANKLPHVLFVCNPNNPQQTDWLEKTLTANAQAPRYRPVVLSPVPVHSIGTFKGLAPLIPSFAEADNQTTTRLLRKNGYFTLNLSVILQDISHEQFVGIASVSEAIITPGKTFAPKGHTIQNTQDIHGVQDAQRGLNDLAPSTGRWLVKDIGAPFIDWVVENTATQESATTRLLLKRSANKIHDNVNVSIILLPPDPKNMSFAALTEACINTHLAMETLVPEPLEDFCSKILPNVRGIASSNEASYVREAVSKAKGQAVWLVKPDATVNADIPQALYMPLMEKTIVTARPSFPPHADCLPKPMDNNTLALPGGEIIQAAAKKNRAILPQIGAALFKRENLLRAIEGARPGKLALNQVVHAVYQEGDVALVPFPYTL